MKLPFCSRQSLVVNTSGFSIVGDYVADQNLPGWRAEHRLSNERRTKKSKFIYG